MKDIDIIRRKLGKMVEYLSKLQPITKVSFTEYSSNYFTRYTAERLVELIVEAAVDINGLLLINLGFTPPKDYYSSFIKMADAKILEKPFAKRIAGTTGLRNRLAHEYEEVEDKIVWNGLKGFMILYNRYIKAVETYLANH